MHDSVDKGVSQNPEAVVRGFFAEMSTPGGLISSVQNWCADACRWENSGMRTAEDKTQMLVMMQRLVDRYQLDRLGVDLPSIAVNGDKVLTERVDHLIRTDGSTVFSVPLTGVLEVRAGKVERWSDYFDPRPFLSA